MEKNLIMSVHQLVDFLLRKGDIDNRIYNKTSMTEGTRLHASYQRRQSDDYIAEFYLCHTFNVDGFNLTLQGRADGIIERPFLSIIDEIKTSVIDNEEFYNSQAEWHLGQAKVYALIYALDKKKDRMGVRLTYINQLDNKQLIKEFTYSKNELEEYVIGLIREYLDFYKMIFKQIEDRNESAKTIEFPFQNYRLGQRELAKYTYSAFKKEEILFVEAPTGIGKTMSTLFPSVKIFAEETIDKVFYLTAKNSGIISAFNASKILLNNGLKAKVIQITAKDKICLCPGRGCNPDECPYARGYYEKIRPALSDLLKNDIVFSKDCLLDYANKYQLCPFEFQLDASLFSDIIICDFNYLFDPIVYMRRYFDETTYRMVGLVDEAHNLVERGREMYSTSLSYSNFKRMKKNIKSIEHKKLKTAVNKIGKIFKEYDVTSEVGYNLRDDLDVKLISALSSFQQQASDYMKKLPYDVEEEFKEYYFDAIRFVKISEFFNGSFKFYIYKDNGDISVNIFNLNPAKLFEDSLSKLKGTVLFSGTLSPLDYYVKLLGGNDSSPVLRIPSPFPRKNLKLMVAPNISTTYKNRDKTYGDVASYIKTAVSQKIGNYFVFFPSYKYLNSVLEYFENEDFIIHSQVQDMKEEEKTAFLDNFNENPTETHIGFAVLGGIFSEGIDLIGNRLIGAIIVGVGLPQISYERDLIRNYFDENEENGFDYAYVKPGMNRVMQAVGRVIRSENDKGIVLLIDERYMQRRYQDLFKAEWNNYDVVLNEKDIETELKKFYEDI
ncbi:MAG: ATP-dependent DNA helicase [Erysipelotrichales bacterium]|nr:ATP-dependent DNA helicase [Erysipelotrichales bacterium]